MDQEIDHHQSKRLKITNPSIEFTRGQTIGHGSFAKVSLAKPANNHSCLPSLVAVKSCGVSHMASLAKERMVYEELKDCPEIVKCYGDSYTVEKGEKLYNVVLEYACGGSLADRGEDGLKMMECDVRKCLKSVLKGIKYIHDKGYVHCDVKLQNVLVFDGGEVKIADFGLAKKVEEKKATCEYEYEVRGTPLYLAPETVVGGVQEAASDIWAVGCLVSEMVTGLPAWTCADVSSLLMKIGVGAETPEIPGGLSDAGKDFLGRCFVKDPSKRWTAEMLLNHPFVNGEDCATSVSPRDPFDFPDWEMDQSAPVTPELVTESGCWIAGATHVSAKDRLRQLVTTAERPNWFDESGWITVR